MIIETLKKRYRVCIYFLTIILILSFTLILQTINHRTPNLPETPKKSDEIAQTRLLFTPDIYLGRKIAALSKQNLNYAFEGLNTLNREKYQAWIGNLECPSVDNVDIEGVAVNLSDFNCNPKLLPYLANYFNYVSQANNHVDNQNGDEGFQKTQRNLKNAGIESFGNFSPLSDTGNCKIAVLDSDSSLKVPVALCGYHFVVESMEKNVDDEIKFYSEFLPVIVMPHSGNEYSNEISQGQIDRYHRMIDAGADLVLGAHPHVVEPAEVYKGKLIVYSMGNFIMDQVFSDQTREGIAMDVLLRFKKNDNKVDSQNISKIVGAAGECNKITAKECNQVLSEKGVSKPHYEINFFPVGTVIDENTLKTSIATNKVYRDILKTLKWGELSEALLKTESGYFSIR